MRVAKNILTCLAPMHLHLLPSEVVSPECVHTSLHETFLHRHCHKNNPDLAAELLGTFGWA